MNFDKKFNIGLTLETNPRDFEKFLIKYSRYIHSIYFSPPLGKLYHTRSKIAAELLIPGKKRAFWKMLGLAKEYGIELELLFNTLRLDGRLIENAAAALSEQGIEVDSVCFIAAYYDDVARCFPGKKYILSFNNGFRTRSEIDAAIDTYPADAFVLGSSFIRNNRFFEHLASRGKEVYLLLNNGCSFNCDTCNNTQSVCERSFVENLRTHSVEYLYALQSIFPCELHDGIIDSTNIKCFKISNRSSNLKFIADAMDSYINCEVLSYIKKSPESYAFWGRAGYFWKYFRKMDAEKIIAYKKELLYNRKKEG